MSRGKWDIEVSLKEPVWEAHTGGGTAAGSTGKLFPITRDLRSQCNLIHLAWALLNLLTCLPLASIVT